jgi:hypothetical protein
MMEEIEDKLNGLIDVVDKSVRRSGGSKQQTMWFVSWLRSGHQFPGFVFCTNSLGRA